MGSSGVSHQDIFISAFPRVHAIIVLIAGGLGEVLWGLLLGCLEDITELMERY